MRRKSSGVHRLRLPAGLCLRRIKVEGRLRNRKLISGCCSFHTFAWRKSALKCVHISLKENTVGKNLNSPIQFFSLPQRIFWLSKSQVSVMLRVIKFVQWNLSWPDSQDVRRPKKSVSSRKTSKYFLYYFSSGMFNSICKKYWKMHHICTVRLCIKISEHKIWKARLPNKFF